MAFGKKGARQEESSRQVERDPNSHNEDLELENDTTQEKEVVNTRFTPTRSHDKNDKPLLEEVTMAGSAKGTSLGELQRLRKKVEDAKHSEISPSLTKSKVSSSQTNSPAITNHIAASFNTVERQQVDVAIVKVLSENRIPFNVLRNPEFIAMLKMEELAPIKDTWTTQGTSIVSNGWKNVEHQPLINVLASNSRGSTFLYAKNFSGVEKTGKTISKFLLKVIDEVGASHVLQAVIDNAANCKAARKKIEKRLKEGRDALATNVVLRSWKDWLNSDNERARTIGAEVASTIGDEQLWEEVDNILLITKPIIQ
ncbi:Tyrosine-protein kinase HCK [Bienertia sinuspersici]